MTNRRPRFLGEEGMGRETYTGSPPICKKSPPALLARQQKARLLLGWGGSPLLRTDLQPLQIFAHDVAIALAARDRSSSREHEDEVTAGRAADLADVIRTHHARPAYTQHRLRLERLLR